MMPTRLRAIRQLLDDPVLSRSYYPDAPRKGKICQLMDNLWWLFRYQEVNYEYHYYGMDRLNSPGAEAYLAKNEFRKTRDTANDEANTAATRGDSRGRNLNYRLVLGDKFVFAKYLKGLGIPTPGIIALGNNKSILWLESDRLLPIESLFDVNIDCFMKENLADGGGRVFTLKTENGNLFINGKPEFLDELRQRIDMGGHYILQERLSQSPELSKIYGGSINTVRLVTMMVNNQPKPFAAIIRVGVEGSALDNWSTGGIAIDIDLETGILGRFGFHSPKFGTRVDRHPDTGFVFHGFKVPYIFDAVQMAVKLHGFFYSFHSIGWDIAITGEGPSFIEGNDDWGLQSIQGPYGGLRKRFASILREK